MVRLAPTNKLMTCSIGTGKVDWVIANYGFVTKRDCKTQVLKVINLQPFHVDEHASS